MEIKSLLKSMGAAFLEDIYLYYYVNFRASWMYFGTDVAQSFQSLVILVKYVCKCQEEQLF